MDCSLQGSSVHGIFQAIIMEWIATSLLQGIFLTQGSNPGLPHCRQILYCLNHQRSPGNLCPKLIRISHFCLAPVHGGHCPHETEDRDTCGMVGELTLSPSCRVKTDWNTHTSATGEHLVNSGNRPHPGTCTEDSRAEGQVQIVHSTFPFISSSARCRVDTQSVFVK